MNPQEHNMAVLGQIVKLIPKNLSKNLKTSIKFRRDRSPQQAVWSQCSIPN